MFPYKEEVFGWQGGVSDRRGEDGIAALHMAYAAGTKIDKPLPFGCGDRSGHQAGTQANHIHIDNEVAKSADQLVVLVENLGAQEPAEIDRRIWIHRGSLRSFKARRHRFSDKGAARVNGLGYLNYLGLRPWIGSLQGLHGIYSPRRGSSQCGLVTAGRTW